MKNLFLALGIATLLFSTAASADEVVTTSKTVTVEHNHPHHYYNHHRYHNKRHCYYNHYHHYVCHYYH